MHKILKSMICLTLAFVAFFASFANAESLSSVSVESAPLSSQQPTLDGMVRVYLSSLGSPRSLSLTISGSYSLSDGTSLTNGETVSVSFSSSTGALSLKRGGVTYTMGSTFTIRRHSTTGTNGIKIAQARKPSNLYPGDIQFKSVSLGGGGYKLYVITHIYIEDYLFGVLPYEMGSSAPMEALKAQAVAARTYTVRMMSARASWSYDVVDTTGDQTYNGTPATATNCNTAVNQTKGILLKNGSAYTATYYSSSNGGQTEAIKNAWGTSGYDYLGVKDDPFDYTNPASVVKQATVYEDAGSSYNSASLMSLLKTKAVSALGAAGYNATSYNTTVQTVKNIAPHTPKYASPSKLYTKMDFTLSVTTYNASNVFVSVTTTVTCDIFGELESILNLSIQSGQNELWSVVKADNAFKIQTRRYGHGIGMSQRGAMYMGQLGFTYDEILGFYYPGSTRVGCVFTNTILSADSSEVISTDENPVDLNDGDSGDTGIRGIVTLSNNEQLAVRNAKSATASVLTVLPNGSPVDVLSNDGTWCLIEFGSIRGYVPTSAISILGTAPESDGSAVSSVDGFAVVTANGYLNLRESGSYSASILSTAPNGAILTVLTWDSEWAHIQYGTIAAYASSGFLSFSMDYPEEIQEPDAGDGGDTADTETLSAIVATQSGSLNMRQFAQAGSAVLTTIPKGALVSVTSQGNTWSGIIYLGLEGYVMTQFLSFDDGTNDLGEQETVETKAMVTTQSGSLNLRQLPQAGSPIFRTIPRLEIVDVHTKGSEWCEVTYAGITGYVMTVFLSFTDTGNTGDDSDTGDDSSGGSETETVTAVVTTESGSLNLRAEALENSSVLTRIPKGETITVLQRLSAWTYTCYQEYYGYVMNAFLTFSQDGDTVEEGNEPVTATVTTDSGSLNLRDEPYGKVLAQIPQFASIDVFNRGSAWCYLNYNGMFGYAMTAYLTFESDGAQQDDTENDNQDGNDQSDQAGDTSEPDVPAEATSAMVSVDAGSLNMRTAKSATATVLTTIPNGTVVELLIKTRDWCKVVYGAYQGYVQTQYLVFNTSDDAGDTSDTDEPEATEEPGDTGDTEDSSYSLTAWVNTVSGSLNLRETASTDAAVVAQIPQYAQIEVLSDIGETWCRTRYGEYTGYTMTEFLTPTQPSQDTTTGDTQPDETDTGNDAPMDPTLHEPSQELLVYIRPPAGSATLPLYDACSEDSELLQNMIENSQVEITKVGDTWCEIIYFDQMGYCMRDGLSFFEE